MPPAVNYTYAATLVRVIDGDTVELSIDAGFRIAVRTIVRLLGINAPEVEGPQKTQGDQAAHFLMAYLPPGMSLTVTTHQDANDKYGRLLADLWLPDGRHVNQIMLDSGHAAPYDGHGPKNVPTVPAPGAAA
jgi:endonuclease YncB( thermonuclease family)